MLLRNQVINSALRDRDGEKLAYLLQYHNDSFQRDEKRAKIEIASVSSFSPNLRTAVPDKHLYG
jgi:hypothetical protein